jgi:hypothetical protein
MTAIINAVGAQRKERRTKFGNAYLRRYLLNYSRHFHAKKKKKTVLLIIFLTKRETRGFHIRGSALTFRAMTPCSQRLIEIILY